MSLKMSEEPWKDVQTVMMRNLPNNCTQQGLLDRIGYAGFSGTFDFFYLPIDSSRGVNRGYAFINFKKPEMVQKFRSIFHGTRLSDFRSKKIIEVDKASIQGFWSNYEYFGQKRVVVGPPETQPLFLNPAKNEPAQSICEQASFTNHMLYASFYGSFASEPQYVRITNRHEAGGSDYAGPKAEVAVHWPLVFQETQIVRLSL
jgi:RNA recognition motif-containing protein